MNEQQGIKPYVIGLDLGGTNSVFGIVDARGEIKATTAIKTGNYEKAEDYVDACVEALQVIIDQVGGIEKIKAMGIGAPNGNYYKGTIEFAPNLPWAHDGVVPLAQLFSERLNNIPCSTDQRCQCSSYRRDGLWCGTRHEELYRHYPRHWCRLWHCRQRTACSMVTTALPVS